MQQIRKSKLVPFDITNAWVLGKKFLLGEVLWDHEVEGHDYYNKVVGVRAGKRMMWAGGGCPNKVVGMMVFR